MPTDAPHGHGLHAVRLASPTDLDGFRRACRSLVAQGVAPQRVTWEISATSEHEAAAEPDLFGSALSQADEHHAIDAGAACDEITPGEAQALRVPAAFAALCDSAILHRDSARFALLYRLLWRFQHESGLRHDPLDADRIAVSRLARAVHRDLHKMKAFVRFTRIEPEAESAADSDTGGPPALPLHVAWFEPEHHIVEAIAPFFMRRFTQMRWAILTPERSVEWSAAKLHFGPPARREQAPPADAGEQLWLTYYQHIFNPARLKLKMMQKEMPRRYWKNLPEAQLISSLAAQAPQQRLGMIEQPASALQRRVPAAPLHRAAVQRQQSAIEPGDGLEAQPHSTAALLDSLQRCRQCPIGQHATQAVGGEGPARARLMLVGEQPGDQEDLRGRPFVGPAGQLLDRALAELRWDRNHLYLTNAVKHFKYEPRGRRRMHKTPSQAEAAACLHWLESEIRLVQPEAAIALGATAAASLLGRHVAVMSERGQWFTRPDGLRVLVTLHPAALLRTEAQHQPAAYLAWLEDLQRADPLARPDAS